MRVPGAVVGLVATFAVVVVGAAPSGGRGTDGSNGVGKKLGKSEADGTNSCFFETLAEGESVDVVEHGPITLTAVCAGEVRIDLSVAKTAGVDDFIIVAGDDEDIALLLVEDYNQEEFLGAEEDDTGDADTEGGVISLGTRKAVDVNGEGVVMWHDSAGVDGFGDGTINCVIAGCATLING